MEKITVPEFSRIIGSFLNQALIPVLASAFFHAESGHVVQAAGISAGQVKVEQQ